MLLLRVSSAALAAVIGLGPLVPPEHVHEREEHGHHRLMVHRHAEAHPLQAPADPRHRSLHDHDDPVLTLTTLFTVPAVPAVQAASPAAIVSLPEPPRAASFHRGGDLREPLIHAPPRAPTSLRAPPRSSRS